MSEAPIADKRQQLEQLRQQVAELERQLHQEHTAEWVPHGFYGTWYGTIGFMIGGIAALVSLVFNMVGSLVAGKDALEIIRVYLTFPLGEHALTVGQSGQPSLLAVPDGMVLALGCCLYIGTGMVLGVFFQWVMSLLVLEASLIKRLLLGSVLATAVWFVNFYLILSWLQPALFGGNWITDNSLLPWWVALATHLVFGWTMAVMLPLGRFSRYERPTETAVPAAV